MVQLYFSVALNQPVPENLDMNSPIQRKARYLTGIFFLCTIAMACSAIYFYFSQPGSTKSGSEKTFIITLENETSDTATLSPSKF